MSNFSRVHKTNPNHIHPRNLVKGEEFEVWRYWDNKWDVRTALMDSKRILEPEDDPHGMFEDGTWINRIDYPGAGEFYIEWDLENHRWEYRAGMEQLVK